MNHTTKPASGLLALALLATLILSACMPLPTPGLPPETQDAAAPQATVQPVESAAPQVTETAVPAPAEAGAPETPSVALEGTLWTLVSYADEAGQTADVLPGVEVTAQFKEGTVSGTAGCNNYFAGYELDGNQLTVELGGTTMMACEEPTMLQESAYLLNLAASASYLIAGDQLQIFDAEGNTLLTYGVQQPLPLVGTGWRLTMYNNGEEALVSVLAGTEITALFGEDGSLSGSAGCNTYRAAFTTTDGTMTVDAPASTRMMCGEPEGIMDQEAAYFAALQKAASYSILGDELDIADADGATLLVFSAVTASPLTGLTWSLVSYNNTRAITSVILETEITAIFGEDGFLSGSAGCNTYRAPYSIEGENISIGMAATTRMMCAEPAGVMEQEQEYLAAIQKAATFKVDGERLDLFGSEGNILAIYNVSAKGMPEPPLAPGMAPAIIGAPWRWVVTLYNNDTKSVPENSENYVLELLPEGQLSVKADCNQAVGTYSLDGDRISINITATTLEACAPGSLADEFIRDLNAAQSYLMDGEDLIIVLKLDTGSMRLEVPDMVPGVVPAVEPPTKEPGPVAIVTPGVEPPAESGGGSADILGVIWKWESFTLAAGNTITVDDPEQYEFMLLPTGAIRVKADCNNGSGTFSMDDNNGISIEVLTLTRMACPPGSLSDDFVQALNLAAAYQVDGENLLFELGEDGGTMIFSPAE